MDKPTEKEDVSLLSNQVDSGAVDTKDSNQVKEPETAHKDEVKSNSVAPQGLKEEVPISTTEKTPKKTSEEKGKQLKDSEELPVEDKASQGEVTLKNAQKEERGDMKEVPLTGTKKAPKLTDEEKAQQMRDSQFHVKENSSGDMHQIRENLRDSGLSHVKTMDRKATFSQVHKVHGEMGASHAYDEDEKFSCASFLNLTLGEEPSLSHLFPIEENSLDVLRATRSGEILCKVINLTKPGTIDEKKVAVKKKLSIFEINNNLTLALEGCKKLGCSVVNVGPEDFKEERVYIVLGMVWQILLKYLLGYISLHDHPELMRLLEHDETMDMLNQMPADHVLLRWVNYHLSAKGSTRRVSNFTSDFRDSECLTLLLSSIAPETCDTSPLQEQDQMKRAELTLQQANKLGCRRFITPNKVVIGHKTLMMAFLANLFNMHPGLEPLSEAELRKLKIMLGEYVEPEPEPPKPKPKAPSPLWHTSLYGFDGMPPPPCAVYQLNPWSIKINEVEDNDDAMKY